jgi:acetyl-CoA acetyltransferase family protein
MTLANTFIPYGGYWSTPFCRWQGSIGHEHSLKLAAATARRFLERVDISPETFDHIAIGFTVPQQGIFYGAPWLAGLIGATGIAGPSFSQACSTSPRVIAGAAAEIETGASQCALGVTFDRTSNGPHILYPNPKGIGGTGDSENWVMDNFGKDPYAKLAMIQTAENVAKEVGITREEQDAVTLLRNEQYAKSLENDRAFQRRYMQSIEARAGKKTVLVEEDEGVFPTTKEGLAKLRPVMEGGTVTFGSQTYPADANAGMIVTTKERAEALSKDKKVPIAVLAFGQGRVKKGFMPTATVPAARQALDRAGLGLDEIKAIKTHNPFAVNDVYFSREMGVATDKVNNYGSPLVYGHPQGPTGMRVIIELIEELVLQGGGHGLFTGCAAGDTAMAVVLRVG